MNRACYLWIAAIAILLGMASTAAQESAGDMAKTILVDLEHQKLFAWEDDDVIHEFHVVTGKCGKETEPGRYKVEWKARD